MRNLCKMLVLKREGGRSMCRWEDAIKIKLKEVEWKYVDWIHLDQDAGGWRAVMNTVIYLRVP
jgi:hypothetical protein